MSDVTSNQPAAAPALKKERSPSFPYIGLSKAMLRAAEVYGRAKRYEVRLTDVAEAWGMGPKSSATLQTIAALSAYGLFDESGSGENRKFKISDLAFKALEDQRPGVKEAALAEAAGKPKLLAEYLETWGAGRPADGICVSELRIDRGFTEEGAKAFLRVFDDTMGFTKQAQRDKKVDASPSGEARIEPPVTEHNQHPPTIKVGDYVQWTSGGSDRFTEPRPVSLISDDWTHLRVVGSMTGFPITEATVRPANIAGTLPREPTASPVEKTSQGIDESSSGSSPEMSVLLRGGRLQITADVDAKGLNKLKEILEKYEEILKLLN